MGRGTFILEKTAEGDIITNEKYPGVKLSASIEYYPYEFVEGDYHYEKGNKVIVLKAVAGQLSDNELRVVAKWYYSQATERR